MATNERLEHAQRLDAIAQLAGAVAHDFNNLLTIILGYTELVMRRQEPDDPSRADLAAVKRAGEHAKALVDQLLTVSGHRVVQPIVLDASETVRSFGDVLRRLVGHGIDVEIATLDVPRIYIDPGQLEQVLLNLVVNARDAMPRGGTLSIETYPCVIDDRDGVELRVRDSGTGMDSATLASCFEPFFTTKSRSRGSGLGLATVDAIVSNAGGEIVIDSVVGRGTTFIVRLPAAAHDLVDLRSPDEAPRGAAILIVDDDDEVRAFARRVLEEAGYIIQAVASGQAALDLVAAGEDPDLVVTDVVMPEMGGVDLVRRLVAQRPSMPILIVSGFSDDPDLQAFSSAAPFLAKPFRPDELLDAVRTVLETAGSRQGSKR